MWSILFVLPNLGLREPIGNQYIAIVPHDDPRVNKITSTSRYAKSLFDFYPITISRHDEGFITSSPSVLGFDDETQDFRGQTSASLAGPGHFSVKPNDDLFKLLEKVWKRRFIRRRVNEWSTRALFRSLEMAYQATAMPFKNHSTIYDYGSSASLWVSAFEVLSHPRTGRADLLSVLDLIGSYEWNDKVIKKSKGS